MKGRLIQIINVEGENVALLYTEDERATNDFIEDAIRDYDGSDMFDSEGWDGFEEWLDEALAYIQKNTDFVDNFLKKNIPQIKVVQPEASFLIWLDCRGLGLPQRELVDLFVNKAKLALNDGSVFGKEGEGFMRLNVGTPLSNIEKALNNLEKAINE